MEPKYYLQTARWRPLPPEGVTPHHTFYNPADGTYCALGLLFSAMGASTCALTHTGFPEDIARAYGFEVPEGLTPEIAIEVMEASDEGKVDPGWQHVAHHGRIAQQRTIVNALWKAGIRAEWT